MKKFVVKETEVEKVRSGKEDSYYIYVVRECEEKTNKNLLQTHHSILLMRKAMCHLNGASCIM